MRGGSSTTPESATRPAPARPWPASAGCTTPRLTRSPSTTTGGSFSRLAGRHLLITFDLLDNDDGRGGFVVYGNDGPDSDEDNSVERSVWVPRGKRVPMKGEAIGLLRLVRHEPAVGADGTEFPGFAELRVMLDR